MKITHQFRGYGVFPSYCNVYIVNRGEYNYVLFEDLNDGTSVTNASEQLASEIVEDYDLDPTKCIFFETYSEDLETFDEISYTWVNNVAINPVWYPGKEEDKNIFLNEQN